MDYSGEEPAIVRARKILLKDARHPLLDKEICVPLQFSIGNVLDIIRRANRESLIIMDELGSGTDPLEGMGIAVAILEELKKSGAETNQRNDNHVIYMKTPKKKKEIPFHRGDSVMIYPDKKIGIICTEANEKGILQVQIPVAAEQLYPEDYDFSIIFDTVENRKLRHQMERKFVEGQMLVQKEDRP